MARERERKISEKLGVIFAILTHFTSHLSHGRMHTSITFGAAALLAPPAQMKCYLEQAAKYWRGMARPSALTFEAPFSFQVLV